MVFVYRRSAPRSRLLEHVRFSTVNKLFTAARRSRPYRYRDSRNGNRRAVAGFARSSRLSGDAYASRERDVGAVSSRHFGGIGTCATFGGTK